MLYLCPMFFTTAQLSTLAELVANGARFDRVSCHYSSGVATASVTEDLSVQVMVDSDGTIIYSKGL